MWGERRNQDAVEAGQGRKRAAGDLAPFRTIPQCDGITSGSAGPMTLWSVLRFYELTALYELVHRRRRCDRHIMPVWARRREVNIMPKTGTRSRNRASHTRPYGSHISDPSPAPVEDGPAGGKRKCNPQILMNDIAGPR
jgi:hypothetical protein